MNLKIHISILKIVILIISKYQNLKLDIWIWKLLFQLFFKLLEFKNFDLNMIFSIWFQKLIFEF